MFLAETDWSLVLECSDVEHALESWSDTVQCAVSQFVPKTVFTARPGNKLWYSSLLHKLRRQKERLFRRAKPFDQQHPLSVAYRKVRNWYTAELRNAERLSYLRLTDSLSNKEMLRTPHRWWALAKSVCGLRARDPVPPLQAGGRAHISAFDRAICLNEAFASQCSAPGLGHLPPVLTSAKCSFLLQPVTVLDVFESLSKLNIGKASGIDGFSNRLLRSCAGVLAGPLCYVFNVSLKTGVFPSCWKSAVVQPFFKLKGERSVSTNSRPIALLPCVSKVLESFVRKQLLAYCLENGLIPDE